jgi:hypothetical protein
VKLLETAAAKNPEKLIAAAAKFTSNNDALLLPDLPEIETDLQSSPSQSPLRVEFNPDKSPASGLYFENEESPAFVTARLASFVV